jgi:hypothetical protein
LGRSRKDPHSPDGVNFCRPERGGEKKLFLIIVNVLGHPKGVGGLTSNFLRGGGMDVLWNDPFTPPPPWTYFAIFNIIRGEKALILSILMARTNGVSILMTTLTVMPKL